MDVLEPDKVEILVVESLVRDELLEEGDELRGLVLVWLGQVDVLEVQDDARGVLGTVHAARLRLRHLAHRRELVDHVRGERLRRAVHDGHVCAALRREELGEQHVLSTALGADEDQRLHALHPGEQHVLIALHRRRAHHRAALGVEVVKGELLRGVLRVQLMHAPLDVEEAVEGSPMVGRHLTGP